jgi:hypothetical protein
VITPCDSRIGRERFCRYAASLVRRRLGYFMVVEGNKAVQESRIAC